MRQTKEASCFGGIDHRPLSQGLSILCSECAGPTPWRWALRRTPAPRNARPEDARSSAFCPSEAPSRPERSDAPPALHRASSVWWPWVCGGPVPPPIPPRRTSRAPERPSSGLSPEHIGDLGIGPGGLVGSIFALGGLEQDARMGQLARRGVATSDQAFQAAAILPGQAHGVVTLPRHREASSYSRWRAAAPTSAGTHDTREGILLQTNHVRTLGTPALPLLAFMHSSAWKGNSANFATTEF